MSDARLPVFGKGPVKTGFWSREDQRPYTLMVVDLQVVFCPTRLPSFVLLTSKDFVLRTCYIRMSTSHHLLCVSVCCVYVCTCVSGFGIYIYVCVFVMKKVRNRKNMGWETIKMSVRQSYQLRSYYFVHIPLFPIFLVYYSLLVDEDIHQIIFNYYNMNFFYKVQL